MDNYKISIFGGTVFGIIPNLPIDDVVLTICMAIIGTISSYIVTVLLKWISRRLDRR
ncbi:hypothetical protein K8089_12100 [Aequorivita sp. F47161]|uniref:Uncharacterized protein n=1 Tax=Aequorivita vitellina TaxID=2874475 RepID=A0A9X1QYN1_9FLAO|nr:hypothetical protein [Aequorivita vitellina]MCG2419767.1 hypothetical protein [Aequorivita vitellina]